MRLLELMVRVQAKPRFTAAELAKEFGVSRRTILRDLQALSGMGVPLRSTPGPGGGHSLPRGGRRLSPSLTVDEALGLIVSYEALLRYPVHPFSSEGISAVTKLRAALPKDALSSEVPKLPEGCLGAFGNPLLYKFRSFIHSGEHRVRPPFSPSLVPSCRPLRASNRGLSCAELLPAQHPCLGKCKCRDP